MGRKQSGANEENNSNKSMLIAAPWKRDSWKKKINKKKKKTRFTERPDHLHYYSFPLSLLALTTYSKTKVSVSLVWMMSWRVTMLACFSCFKSDASRMAVKGAPSSSCSRISFSATTWFVRLRKQDG